MPLSTHPLPLIEPALPALARWLLDRSDAGCPEAIASMLVLLPSHRAGGQLGHALLEAAGGSALILPRILTPDRLAEHLRAKGWEQIATAHEPDGTASFVVFVHGSPE